MKKKISKKLKAVDFFCGAGGVTCGFKKIGIEVVGGIDFDPKHKDTYEKNNNAIFVNQDVSNLEPAKLAKFLPVKKNDDDLIFVGCSPCQYFSNLKSDKEKSKAGRLLLEDFQEFVLFYKPGFVFIENVPGLSYKSGSPLYKFKIALKKEGYNFEQKVLNAKYFGVPQNRMRFILVASRVIKSVQLPKYKSKNRKIRTVLQAIGNYKKFSKVEHGFKDTTDFQHSVSSLSDLNLERVRQTPKNGGSRRAWEKNKKLQLKCYEHHDGHTDVYGRLAWNKPSPTITTRFTYTSTGRYTHPEQDRALSLREGATLQSFPTNYKFHSASHNFIATMIGNAVPPRLAEAIGKSILNQWTKWQNSLQGHEQ